MTIRIPTILYTLRSAFRRRPRVLLSWCGEPSSGRWCRAITERTVPNCNGKDQMGHARDGNRVLSRCRSFILFASSLEGVPPRPLPSDDGRHGYWNRLLVSEYRTSFFPLPTPFPLSSLHAIFFWETYWFSLVGWTRDRIGFQTCDRTSRSDCPIEGKPCF